MIVGLRELKGMRARCRPAVERAMKNEVEREVRQEAVVTLAYSCVWPRSAIEPSCRSASQIPMPSPPARGRGCARLLRMVRRCWIHSRTLTDSDWRVRAESAIVLGRSRAVGGDPGGACVPHSASAFWQVQKEAIAGRFGRLQCGGNGGEN